MDPRVRGDDRIGGMTNGGGMTGLGGLRRYAEVRDPCFRRDDNIGGG
ncbi:hypothetical protein BH10BAC5_BH10BAC5_21240 [soil metagenome]